MKEDTSGMEACLETPLWWHKFGECLRTTEQLVGVFFFGAIAMVTWLVAHIILCVVRHRRYRRQGVSFSYSLLHTSLADGCCLVGALLSQQYSIQVIFAFYLLSCDMVNLAHYCICKIAWSKAEKKQRIIYISALPWMFGIWRVMDIIGRSPSHDISDIRVHGRILLSIKQEDAVVILGYSLGVVAALLEWLGCLFYVRLVIQERRFPPLWLGRFCCAIFTNVAYVISIVLQTDDAEDVVHTLPWTVGKLGTAGIQLGMLLQIYINKKKSVVVKELEDEVVSLLRDEYPNFDDELQHVTLDSADMTASLPFITNNRRLMTKSNPLKESREESDDSDLPSRDFRSVDLKWYEEKVTVEGELKTEESSNAVAITELGQAIRQGQTRIMKGPWRAPGNTSQCETCAEAQIDAPCSADHNYEADVEEDAESD